MSKEITTEQMNEAIALFMGLKPVPSGTKRLGDIKHSEIPQAFLNYHSSWSDLMPVVEKIETPIVSNGKMIWAAADVEILYKACIIEYEPDEMKIHTHGKTKLEAVYNAVWKFIKWYNQSNTTNYV